MLATCVFHVFLVYGLVVPHTIEALLPAGALKRMTATDSEANRTGSCGTGHFRWNVKILEDADRGQVKTMAVQTTIDDLSAVPKPAEPYPHNKRIKPWELQVYTVRARLKGVLPSRDGDIHLLLEDPAKPGEHIIAEIPAPECVHDARQAEKYRAARATVSALKLNSVVEVTGVGFFDETTGLQFLKAKNGIELHPVFNISAVRDK